ncbi:hypothetical protein LTR53_010902 [Teratosphaeriaceae sp. CCFEE 6253]|nr:hypothetical protein LTR53_010902 [Teratosphaeriaceae sp. CCFEE 6253]
MAARKRKADTGGGDIKVRVSIFESKHTRTRIAAPATGRHKRSKQKQGIAKKPEPELTRRVTRTMTIDGPRQAVFQTAEMLENILLHLPARSIFGAQRVCRQFRDIVATSIQLRKRLFLTPPDVTATETWIRQGSKHEKGLIRLSDTVVAQQRDLMQQHHTSTAVFKSAALLGPVVTLGDSSHHAASRMIQGYEKIVCAVENALLLSPASWKETYLTDRPCNSALIHIQWEIKGQSSMQGQLMQSAKSTSPHGFTLGGLLQKDGVRHEYHAGGPVNYQGRLADLIKHLEDSTGGKAIIASLVVRMNDVILLSEEERGTILDG